MLTSIGSARLAGGGTSPVAAFVSSVRSRAPSPRTTMPREKSAVGVQVSATSYALAIVSWPRHVMRRIRTVSVREPVAPSISSAPPLRTTSWRTTTSSPVCADRRTNAIPMNTATSSAMDPSAMDSERRSLRPRIALRSVVSGSGIQNVRPTENCTRTWRTSWPYATSRRKGPSGVRIRAPMP